MTKARTLADFNTTGVLTSTSNLNASKLSSGTIPNDRYGTPTFNGSSLTGIDDAGLNTKIITGTYNSASTATITTPSLGFEAKHVICRFNLEDVSNSSANYNISFGNATKTSATTSAYACSYNYFNQTGTQQAHDTVTTCMGRLAYGGGRFNNLKVSAWGSDTITLFPEINGGAPSHSLSYQLIIQG